MTAILISAVLLGLAANLHCIGMCGPISMALPLDRSSNWKILSGALTFHFGRLLTYSLLGGFIGLIGLSITTLGIMQWLSILSGIVLIIFAWRGLFGKIFSGNAAFSGISMKVSRGMGKLLKSRNPAKLLFLGMLNGVLPCGMVFAALLNALLAGSPMMSGIAMFTFGVGTLPALLVVAFAAQKIGSKLRSRFNQVAPYFLTIIGILVVLRGMNLDIPLISPHIQVTEVTEDNSEEAAPEVEMSCCHGTSSCDK